MCWKAFYLALFFALWPLTFLPEINMAYPWLVCVGSFMMIGVKGRELCDFNILPNEAFTDQWTDGQMDKMIPVYPANRINAWHS